MKRNYTMLSFLDLTFYFMTWIILFSQIRPILTFMSYNTKYKLTSTYSDKHSKVFSSKLFLDCLVSIVRIWPPKFLLNLWEWRFLRVEDLESLLESLESDSSTSPNSIICNIINQLRLKLVSIASRLNEILEQLYEGKIDKQFAEKFVVKNR